MTLVLLALLGMGPFEKNHPSIGDGEAAFERGDYEAALQKFDEADKDLPNNAQVAFDRGTALHKLGRHEEARAAFMKAAELNQGKQPLESKIHYNLGNSWAATSNKKEAVTEYRKALRKDPADERARHNLEVLLKDLPPPQQNQPDGGQDGGGGDAGQPDAGSDGGKPQDAGPPRDGGHGDAGQGDGGADGGADGGSGGDGGQGDGGQGDGGRGDGQQGKDGGGQGGDRGDGGADGGEAQTDGGAEDAEAAELSDGGQQMSKRDAERMLDSMKNTERNMQLWRFRPEGKDKRRRNEKDW